ncbi:myosin light chain kinase, smooth muscle-like isoform X2 [Symsagittifera roscoffensis]|uniref:myosin light chain kinase, smooth muscle-like isoform X2 n=1 Tax=Symsagittifera roscoffensis TaxID=84072 RepID=UPI00307C3769
MAQQPAQVFDFRAKLKKVSTGTGAKPTKPSFKLPMLSVATEKGKKFTLKCGVTGYPKPVITWMNKGQKVTESDTVKMYTDKQDPELHILEILKAEAIHAGEWTVEAANQVGKETMSAKVSIKKQSKPIVVEPMKNTEVFKGQNLKLRVKYEGCPTPSCKWTRAGKEISERRGVDLLHNEAEGTKELVIYDVSDLHSGEYAVELKNAAGTEVCKCTVKVKEAMIKPAFDGDIKGNKIDWGKEFRLSTRVSGNPKPKVKWMKDGVEVKDGENGVKLVSDDVTGKHELIIADFGPEHIGNYQCVAESEAGTEIANYACQPEKPPKKPKIEQPLTATKALRGTPLRLVAKVSGEPQPDLIWTKNGKPLDVGGKDGETFFDFETGEAELIVKSMDDVNAGQYELKVVSRIGSDVTGAKVDIQEPPQQKPTFDIPLSTIYDPAKKLLILKCKISGYPKPDLTWSGPDGKTLVAGPEVEFKDSPDDPDMKIVHILNFTEAKEGEYSATAVSPAGTSKRSINISIKQTKQENTNRPQFEIPLKVDFDPMNGRIVLSCRVSGEPKPEVKWLKYNEELKSDGDYQLTVDENNNQVLTISNVSSTHHGDYSCMATSTLGMAKQTCTLVLKEKPKVEMVDRPVLEKGKPFLLGFKVTGGENIKVRWLRNGEELQTAEGIELSQEIDVYRLRISALNEASAGDYTIEAAGEGGTVRSTISLSFSEGGAAERAVILIKLDNVAIKEIVKTLSASGYKLAGAKIVKARLDLLQNQLANNPDLMGKLVNMPDGPMFVSVWEGSGVCAGARAKCETGGDAVFSSIIHCSGSTDAGKKELGVWFKPYEVSAWNFADFF